MLPPIQAIIDISQPVDETSGHFPGDTSFSRDIIATLGSGCPINLSKFTMSPHVGTHSDAPRHVEGPFEAPSPDSWRDLSPFMGPAVVMDVSPYTGPVTLDLLGQQWDNMLIAYPSDRPRVLLKTQSKQDYRIFPEVQGSIGADLAQAAVDARVPLIAIDTHSVDPVDAKTLTTHHILLHGGCRWIENIDLTHVKAGSYYLVALPLRVETLDAAPTRAVLLQF